MSDLILAMKGDVCLVMLYGQNPEVYKLHPVDKIKIFAVHLLSEFFVNYKQDTISKNSIPAWILRGISKGC